MLLELLSTHATDKKGLFVRDDGINLMYTFIW